jgi:hypothetical protein
MGQRVISAFQAQFVPQCVNLFRLRFNPVGCGKPHGVNIAGGPLRQIDFSRQIFWDRLSLVKRAFLAVAHWPACC